MKKRYKKQRNDPGYEEFRQKVLNRDKHQCQMPGCTNKNRRWLQVHHILNYSSHASSRTDPNNGITLCYGCHNKIKGKEQYYAKVFTLIIQRNASS